MIIEAAALSGDPVLTSTGKKVGTVDRIVFNGAEARAVGIRVNRTGLRKKFSALGYEDALTVDRDQVTIDSEAILTEDLKLFDDLTAQFGSVLGVTAKTESGKKIGRVTDVLIDADTGLIVRFYLHQLLQERIIPRRFLVSIQPKVIVFQDVVDAPVFDNIAANEVAAA